MAKVTLKEMRDKETSTVESLCSVGMKYFNDCDLVFQRFEGVSNRNHNTVGLVIPPPP